MDAREHLRQCGVTSERDTPTQQTFDHMEARETDQPSSYFFTDSLDNLHEPLQSLAFVPSDPTDLEPWQFPLVSAAYI
jgi:hypothetical protein